MTSRIPVASARRTPDYEVLPNSEVPQANRRAHPQRQPEASSRLATLAETRRRSHDSSSDEEGSSEHRVRQNIGLLTLGEEGASARQGQLPVQAATAELPEEIQADIARRLRSTDMFQTFTDLHALSMVSIGFRQAIKRDERLRYDELRRKVDEANALVSEMSNDVIVDKEIMRSLGVLMPLLSPANRERLVEVTTSIDNEPVMADLLAGLAARIAHMSDTQRERLVAAATGIGHEWYMARAVADLAPRMAHLSGTQRERRVASATGIDDESCMARALAGLSTLRGLGVGMNHLNEAQRDRLIADAAGIVHEQWRTRALAELHAGMDGSDALAAVRSDRIDMQSVFSQS